MSIERPLHSYGDTYLRTSVTRSGEGQKTLNDSRTVSKSAQSKIKNLAYTLSSPFRALVKQIIQSRSHERAGFNPMTNIKSPVSPANQGKQMTLQTGEAVEVFEVCDSSMRQSLFGKIFG